jgi:hypothetical protein
MGDLSKRTNGTTPATTEPNLFEAYGNAATANAIEGMLLKFNKGDFIAGKEGEEVPIGTKLVAIMDTLSVGWKQWEDNVPGESRMGLVADGFQPPRRSDLGDTDKSKWETDDEDKKKDPWQFSNQLVMRDQEDGQVYTFVTASRGGLDAVGELCKVYGKAIRQKPDQYPVVELDCGSYQHRDRSIGRVKFPVFKVVAWVNKADTQDTVPATPVEPPPKPTPKAGAARTQF